MCIPQLSDGSITPTAWDWTADHMPAAFFHFPGHMCGNNKTGQPNR